MSLHDVSLLAFIGMPGPMELGIIAFIALLLFGKRLPETMRALGSSIVSFKKGLNDIEDLPSTVDKITDEAAARKD